MIGRGRPGQERRGDEGRALATARRTEDRSDMAPSL